MAATRKIVQQQIRGFVVIWTAVTVLIGTAAFLSIYLAYGSDIVEADSGARQNSVGLPAASTPIATAPLPTATLVESPTTTPAVVAMAAQDTIEQVVAPPVVTPTPLPVNDRDFHLGIQVQFSLDLNPDTQRIWMNDVERLGLQWIKQQVRWSDIERERGVYDWSKLDLALPIAQEYGFRVVASVLSTPDWAREPGVDLTSVGPPANDQDFANFLTAMLNRYPHMIHAIEVWNEPNLDREWMAAGGVSAVDYVNLLRVSYTTIKNIDPGIIVISGAPSPTGGLPVGANGLERAIDDFAYLDQLIAAGLLQYSDCVGVHHNGYNVSPQYRWDEVPNDPTALFRGPFDNPHHSWSFRSTLETYADKIAVAGGTQPLCITEFGWPSVEDLEGYPTGFEFAVDNTLAEQAEYLLDAVNLMDEWGFVWIATIWNLNYGPQAGWSTESDNTPYSLIGPNWAQRPAYQAIAEWSAARNGQ